MHDTGLDMWYMRGGTAMSDKYKIKKMCVPSTYKDREGNEKTAWIEVGTWFFNNETKSMSFQIKENNSF